MLRLGHNGGVLNLVLPKGSLEKATLELFAAADLSVHRSSEVDYRASIDDPRIDEVRILRPQEIPVYVAEGRFDIGITGRDWIEERGVEVVSLGELAYSKATSNPIRVVLAVKGDSPYNSIEDLKSHPGKLRVSTDYPDLTARALAAAGLDVVEITETGRALRAAGLKIIHTLLTSRTELVANPAAAADPAKRHAMNQIMTLLAGTLEARDKVLVKLNVGTEQLDAVLSVLPSLRSPTISELSKGAGYAVETVADKRTINTLIPALKDQGATDILELPLSKIVH